MFVLRMYLLYLQKFLCNCKTNIDYPNYITRVKEQMLGAKKHLKIPKGKSELVSRRTTDNTMAKRKRTQHGSTKHTH